MMSPHLALCSADLWRTRFLRQSASLFSQSVGETDRDENLGEARSTGQEIHSANVPRAWHQHHPKQQNRYSEASRWGAHIPAFDMQEKCNMQTYEKFLKQNDRCSARRPKPGAAFHIKHDDMSFWQLTGSVYACVWVRAQLIWLEVWLGLSDWFRGSP